MENSILVERLKKGDEDLFKELYDYYLDDFLRWASQIYALDRDEILDSYQEAISVLYMNAYSGKLQNLNVSLKTYLYAIGKNHIHNKIKKNKNLALHEQIQDDWQEGQDFISEEIELDENVYRLRKVLENIGEPCKTIIELTFLQNLTNKSIANYLNYKSPDVLKTKKSRCLKIVKQKMGIKNNGKS